MSDKTIPRNVKGKEARVDAQIEVRTQVNPVVKGANVQPQVQARQIEQLGANVTPQVNQRDGANVTPQVNQRIAEGANVQPQLQIRTPIQKKVKK